MVNSSILFNVCINNVRGKHHYGSACFQISYFALSVEVVKTQLTYHIPNLHALETWNQKVKAYAYAEGKMKALEFDYCVQIKLGTWLSQIALQPFLQGQGKKTDEQEGECLSPWKASCSMFPLAMKWSNIIKPWHKQLWLTLSPLFVLMPSLLLATCFGAQLQRHCHTPTLYYTLKT